MTLTSSFMVLVMIMVWKTHIVLVILYVLVIGSDDACSSTGTGLERTGSLGWTKEAGGRDWRMPDCLWRDRITAC